MIRRLPKKRKYFARRIDARPLYEEAGFKIVGEDEHFYQVEMPDFWNIKRTEDKLWFSLESQLKIFYSKDGERVDTWVEK